MISNLKLEGISLKTAYWRFLGGILFLVLGLSPLLNLRPAHAQSVGEVQVLSGRIEPGDIILYVLPELLKGRTL